MFIHAQELEVGHTSNTDQVASTPLGLFAHGPITPLRSGQCVRCMHLAAVLANLTFAQHNVTTGDPRIIVIPVGPPRLAFTPAEGVATLLPCLQLPNPSGTR